MYVAYQPEYEGNENAKLELTKLLQYAIKLECVSYYHMGTNQPYTLLNGDVLNSWEGAECVDRRTIIILMKGRVY